MAYGLRRQVQPNLYFSFCIADFTDLKNRISWIGKAKPFFFLLKLQSLNSLFFFYSLNAKPLKSLLAFSSLLGFHFKVLPLLKTFLAPFSFCTKVD
jgi:hypothetical protein